MTFLLLAIGFSTCNHLLFKAFARYRVDLLRAIVGNYLTCVVIGYGSSSALPVRFSVLAQAWYLLSVVQGVTLVTCFFLIGRTTEEHGVAPASLATRLSVIIPTLAAFVLYDDLVSVTKITGVLAAILALYLSCTDHSGPRTSAKLGKLPMALFAAFGAHATLIKLVQEHFLTDASYHAYVMSSFLWAFVISATILGWLCFSQGQSHGQRLRCTGKDLLSGLVLGGSNYGAVYFLIRVLAVPGWQSSQLFPTISIAVVGCSSLGAWAVFSERISRQMLMALAIGAVAIVLVNQPG